MSRSEFQLACHVENGLVISTKVVVALKKAHAELISNKGYAIPVNKETGLFSWGTMHPSFSLQLVISYVRCVVSPRRQSAC